jgi:hypothetical protein
MEFHITMPGAVAARDAIEQALQAFDAGALVDIDPTGASVRVAAAIDAPHLLALMGEAGYPLAPQQLMQVASTCCGGCSG